MRERQLCDREAEIQRDRDRIERLLRESNEIMSQMKQERLELNSRMKETENKQNLHLKLERPRSFENVVAPNGDDDDGYRDDDDDDDDDNDDGDDDGAGSFDSGRRDTESGNYKILKCPWSVQTQTAQDADYKILRCAPSVHTQQIPTQ